MNRRLQIRMWQWLLHVFPPAIVFDKKERAHRFGEEALELLQASDVSKEEVLQLVDYVYGRLKGEQYQEVGGVMFTLFMLCHINHVDAIDAAEDELHRAWTMVDKIREKQKTKPKFSPLPGKSV